jgi:hypothetical protein
MEYRSSWGANIRPANKEILRVLPNPKVYCYDRQVTCNGFCHDTAELSLQIVFFAGAKIFEIIYFIL